MTVVFVHGVPETPAAWNALRERIDRPALALPLPGFGSPRPAGLADKEAYAAWLADELRALGGPVDLVGHDWGAHLAMRVVSAYDVPVRSWVSDVAHGWHPGYRWHEAAVLFQQSPQGEELLASLRADSPGSPSFGDFLRPRGMSAELATEVDAVHDEVMSAAVLALYRSARPHLHADWGREFDGPASERGRRNWTDSPTTGRSRTPAGERRRWSASGRRAKQAEPERTEGPCPGAVLRGKGPRG
ncbi:alpha/beta hydrolase [Streptomyces globisporus]|uniref:alpha/beta hydrolase n=1 Tax=Streptomyces globisporus TaxID=1908 RepID=UPI00029A3731|nr:alpha/beta hydrolase [Streptomyces globisporus]